MKIKDLFLLFIFTVLIALDSWGAALPVPDESPPPGTPEIPNSLAPFIAAIAIGGAFYWRANNRKKDESKNPEDEKHE